MSFKRIRMRKQAVDTYSHYLQLSYKEAKQQRSSPHITNHVLDIYALYSPTQKSLNLQRIATYKNNNIKYII